MRLNDLGGGYLPRNGAVRWLPVNIWLMPYFVQSDDLVHLWFSPVDINAVIHSGCHNRANHLAGK